MHYWKKTNLFVRLQVVFNFHVEIPGRFVLGYLVLET